MNRTRPLNRSAVQPTNRDLTVGLVGAIISLAATLYQNMMVGDQTSNALLMQSLAPIKQMLDHLMRKIRATPVRAQPPATRHTFTAGTRSATLPPLPSRTPARGVTSKPATVVRHPKISSTFKASSTMDSSRSTASKPSFVVPPGWREISNLDDWMDDSMDNSDDIYPQMDSDAMDETPMMSGFEYSQDQDYYPSYNVEVADLESSKTFQPTFQSTMHFGPRNATTSRQSPLPKRVTELRRSEPSRQTFRQADGTYAVRETINTTNPDGSFQRITKTVSGPDVSIIQNLNETVDLPSLNRTYAGSDAPNATFAVPPTAPNGGNVTFKVPSTAGPSNERRKLDLYLLLCQSATALLLSLMRAAECSNPSVEVAVKQKVFQLMKTLQVLLRDQSQNGSYQADQTPLRTSRSIRDMSAAFRRSRPGLQRYNTASSYQARSLGENPQIRADYSVTSRKNRSNSSCGYESDQDQNRFRDTRAAGRKCANKYLVLSNVEDSNVGNSVRN
ncbi:uncharacterized protein LOC129719528 [Wyeomyia smithii]|uniref:uncharacterized protein LOC129719528 n=1 Tax=Wyeomyia smithii TaxID=174621 RepID=UPI0024682035|nr:uncharacterized protein LOC129719528 [Wyeomyia smithii]